MLSVFRVLFGCMKKLIQASEFLVKQLDEPQPDLMLGRCLGHISWIECLWLAFLLWWR